MNQQSHTFQVIFSPEPEGGFTVTVPTIPECITYGATFEEATANAKEALELCLEHRTDLGELVKIQNNQSAIISSISISTSEIHV